MITTYEEAVEYINSIPRFNAKNDPKATSLFLSCIGDVSSMIPTVHVAGTNGKGSVCAFIRDGLRACGYSVGMFISPHLVTIRERFAINDEYITREEFLTVFSEILDAVDSFRKTSDYSKYHPSYFEFLFFMGVKWFIKKKPEVLVLETGLGGRLDATNSITAPKVCVITEIGLDHMEYLGNTKELIAAEKAGIIKNGVPVVYCDREESVNEVFEKAALKANAKAHKIGMGNIKNFKTEGAGVEFSLQSLYDKSADFVLNTRALYQVENASLAYAAIELLKDSCLEKIDFSKVRQGFGTMYWPGRMELVLPDLVIDGAHNQDGIRAFLDSVSKDGANKRILIYSQVSDKQIEEVAKLIADSRLFDKVYITLIDSYRAADRDRLLNAFSSMDRAGIVFSDNIEVSLKVSEEEVMEGGMRYVAGSLYLVGEVKAYIERGKGND